MLMSAVRLVLWGVRPVIQNSSASFAVRTFRTGSMGQTASLLSPSCQDLVRRAMTRSGTFVCHFQIPAECVRELHLAGRATLGFKKPRICNEDAGASCARGRYIQSIRAV